MQKIPTLFVRDPERKNHVLDHVYPGCEWVIAGEGRPTRKIDGMCCLIRDGAVFKRREFKVPIPNPLERGMLVIPEGLRDATERAQYEQTIAELVATEAKSRIMPGVVFVSNDFEVVAYDVNTEKLLGWMPVTDSKEDARHRDAAENHRYLSVRFSTDWPPPDGTYELIGPKVNGNPEKVDEHLFVEHGYTAAVEQDTLDAVPRDFEGLRAWMQHVADSKGWEGIVWHHPDGRRAKLKRKDFPRAFTDAGPLS